MTIHPEAARLSPAAVRNASFPIRRRGLDEREVHAYLDLVADRLTLAEQELADMRKEMTSLREKQESEGGEEAISEQAVMLFSQAQQIADTLIAEAVEQARDLMATARAQQREIMDKAHTAAQSAAEKAVATTGDEHRVVGGGYDKPVPEVEYVRTYARVAQVQLRAVLDALTEQVEKLGEVPRMEEARQQHSGRLELSWQSQSSQTSLGRRQMSDPLGDNLL